MPRKGSDKDLVIVETVGEGQRLVEGERGLLGATKSAVWVDARTKSDYDAGHIPGAISLPFERVSLDYYIIEDKPIVIVYGAEYNDNRARAMSKRLFELLKDHDIRTLDGGVRAWTAAGNELETSAAR
jgi:3-mercaptopyruvate sulfurtransferase SseA